MTMTLLGLQMVTKWRFLSEHMIHLVIYWYGYIPHYKVELVSSLFIFNRAAISKYNLMAYQYRAL